MIWLLSVLLSQRLMKLHYNVLKVVWKLVHWNIQRIKCNDVRYKMYVYTAFKFLQFQIFGCVWWSSTYDHHINDQYTIKVNSQINFFKIWRSTVGLLFICIYLRISYLFWFYQLMLSLFWLLNSCTDQTFKYIVRNGALPIHYVQHELHLLSSWVLLILMSWYNFSGHHLYEV